MRVLVVGAGLSGLTTAVTLLMRGHIVDVSATDMPAVSASIIAGAIWHPFFQEPDAAYLRRAAETYSALDNFVRDPKSGIMRRTLTEFFTTQLEGLWWESALPYARRIAASELSEPYHCAYQVPVLVADTPAYLAYLTEMFLDLGGRFKKEFVQNLGNPQISGYDVTVNCSGFGASYLCRDRSMDIVRGVVIEVEKPAHFAGCFIDDSNQYRPTYVIERANDCILGGTAEPAQTGTHVDPSVVDDIMVRCARLAPAIANARIKRCSVGFRPRRPTVRLGADESEPGLFHNYGHGGSGFTLSWGCASELAALLEQAR